MTRYERLDGVGSVAASRAFCALTLCGLSLVISRADAASAADPTIAVSVASWGYGAERVNVAEDVAKYCDAKPSCEFKTVTESFPRKADPSPGNEKGLIVNWKCGDVTHKYQFAEGKMAKLTCD